MYDNNKLEKWTLKVFSFLNRKNIIIIFCLGQLCGLVMKAKKRKRRHKNGKILKMARIFRR